MGTRNAKVDAYIAKSGDFAQPILRHLREIVHEACPDVEEEMKWSFPHFTYKGMFASMAAFKGHCAFGFGRANKSSAPIRRAKRRWDRSVASHRSPTCRRRQ